MRYEIGRVLDGQYEILGVLGSGDMSETYKARDRQSGQCVVLKVPASGALSGPAMYGREIEAGRRLEHPNIQRLIASGQLSGDATPFVALEYVDGQTLRGCLDRRAPLPVSNAIQIAMQLADAVQYCHERGVIHRDLKPANVLVASQNRIKVTGFGSALLRGVRSAAFRWPTGTEATLDYAAPELTRGERGDARSDIYAVGVMLYEMLAGEVPSDGTPPAHDRRSTAKGLPLVSQTRPEVSAQLEAVIFRALRRSPGERYQSMAELRHDLEYLDEVTVPDYARVGLEQGLLGVLPAPLITAGIVLAVLGFLVVIGVIAQLLRHSM